MARDAIQVAQIQAGQMEEPARQGTGVGGALLLAVQALAEAVSWPTVLLTFRARNVPF